MITLMYASLLGLVLVVLSGRVILMRRTYQVGLGSGERHDLQRAIRAQGNFIEYTPFALLLLVLLEMQGAPATQVHVMGAVLVIARLLHAFGLSRYAGLSWGRMLGMVGTLGVLLAAAVFGLIASVR